MKLWHWVVITWMATFCVGMASFELYLRHRVTKVYGKAMWEAWR